MRIYNNSNYTVFVNDFYIVSGDYADISEHIFDTINLHCNVGSSVITCEYGKRYIENYGNLYTEETDLLDDNGSKRIVIKNK